MKLKESLANPDTPLTAIGILFITTLIGTAVHFVYRTAENGLIRDKIRNENEKILAAAEIDAKRKESEKQIKQCTSELAECEQRQYEIPANRFYKLVIEPKNINDCYKEALMCLKRIKK